MRSRTTGVLTGLLAAAGLCAAAHAQPQADLARYYGFDPMRIIVVDDNCGPVVTGDFNNDGRPDIAVVNNRKSRIEIHYLRASERTDAERGRVMRANELPPSPWYDRQDVSVSHRVTALRAVDVNGDNKLDIVYAGGPSPSEVVVLRQESPTSFHVAARRVVRGLAARQAGLAVADIMGDGGLEVAVIADKRLAVFPLGPDGTIGEPTMVGTPAELAAFFVEDYNGDGLLDVLGVVPDDATPLRLWLQSQDPRRTAKEGLLASEIRFEMPGVIEVEPVRFPDRKGASVAVIERATRRLVAYDLVSRPMESRLGAGAGGEQQVRAAVWAFTDGATKDRATVVTDLDGDGLLDLLATDASANTVVWYRQSQKIGLGAAEPFSAFKKPKAIAVGEWNGKPGPEVFVLSEEEKAVGVSEFDPKAGRLEFPRPLTIKTAGGSPVAMGYVRLGTQAGGGGEQGMLAVILKDRRDHTLELHRPDGEVTVVPLPGVSRSPQSMLAADADQDGVTDLMLFTPNEPMVMVRATGGEGEPKYQVLTDKDMPQYGLVQAAGPSNTALLDVDGDGKQEVLIADANFVRACRYDVAKGWIVVEQVTMPEPGTSLVGLATLRTGGASGEEIVLASDKGNGRLVLIGRDGKDGEWGVRRRLRLMGFPLGPIFAGAFAGDGEPTVLCIGDDGFGLVRLAGERYELDPFAFYRSEQDGRAEHEIEVGDINGDGYVDLVVLDAGERMCQILSFTARRNLVAATEFEVFQSRLFGRGSSREQEPRSGLVADVTGDGRDDIVLTVHDRLIIYPQATEKK
jgi:hypothetical protein